MGASYSCSVVDGDDLCFRSFPVELVLDILLYLPIRDLTSCQCVNRAIHSLIENEESIQHRMETVIMGVMDNPRSSLSLCERRVALARRQQAWDTLKPQITTTSTGGDHLPDIVHNGIHFKLFHRDFPNAVGYRLPQKPGDKLSGTWSYLPTRTGDDYENSTVAVSLEDNDLVAIGIQRGNVTMPLHGISYPHTLEVDLVCFSLGGVKHPSAKKSTLLVKDGLQDELRWERWNIQLEIRKNLLGVLARPSRLAGQATRPESELWFFDWKTGQKVAFLKGQGIDAFRFLSSDAIVVADRICVALQLFTLPLVNTDAGPKPLTRIGELGLPPLNNGFDIGHLVFWNMPGENLVAGNKCLRSDVDTYTKPFIKASDDIISVLVNVRDERGAPGLIDNLSFVVHLSALLHHHSSFSSYGNPQDIRVLPWRMWGPPVTRWFDHAYESRNVCGQRCLLTNLLTWKICDFNPYRVRRLGKDFAEESETSRLSVETAMSCVKSDGIKDGVYSSLPYVKVAPKQWPLRGRISLDDDRILIQRVSPDRYLQFYVR